MSGAIRKMTFQMSTYNEIAEAHGIEELTDAMVENEEEAYHISTAFIQGIHAARGNQGKIDTGNQDYLWDTGINGTAAQMHLNKYFLSEVELAKTGEYPTKEMEIQFIKDMIEEFKGCTEITAKHRGISSEPTQIALLKE
jgi:hypothetical protein